MNPVIVESPYAGNVKKNLTYSRFCMHDCLVNYNEAPFASHLLYTQEHILNDDVPLERRLGIDAGFVWRSLQFEGAAIPTVFYVDLSWTPGMLEGVEDCRLKWSEYCFRILPVDLWNEFNKSIRE